MESWEKKVKEAYLAYDDTPTYIKAYRKNDLYIVHGEIAIYCFDQNLEKKWEFFGRDIWVLFCTLDDAPLFRLNDGVSA